MSTPPQFQNMMLIASSQGTVVPSEINEEAVRFFSSPDRIQAQLFIISKLEAEGVECNISSALTTLSSYGNLIWASPITPSGLFSMVISSRDIFGNEVMYDSMVLELSKKHEISKQSLNKLTKTNVLFPQDIESMLDRFHSRLMLKTIFME